jgi:type II secretory pathway pseudopilin PulG
MKNDKKEDEMFTKMTPRKRKREGFTLIEAVVGIALVAIAVLGLAEMFTVSVMNNLRSDRITNAAYLAQQRLDGLRNLTTAELNTFASTGSVDLNGDGTADMVNDELLDLNLDGHNDYRRLTQITVIATTTWSAQVMIFSPEQFGVARGTLLASPDTHRVKANLSTVISRP